MRTLELGQTGLNVSAICLGSMTWGSQDTEANGHAQIDYALERGVDFIDTAEMYPVNPVKKETAGRTEEIIGSWIAASGKRDKVVIASKIAGNGMLHPEGITAASVTASIEASLARLKTDYIDLYQMHWPNRGSYHFRQNWTFAPDTQPSKAEITENMIEVLGALDAAVKAGKIRHVGLSNDSAWGMMKWLELAAAGHGPRMATIQNEYSLMCRLYDTDLAELGQHEQVTLLAYSPLAAGILSGKYSGGAVPAGSRLEANGNLGGRANPRAFEIADRYVAVARDHGLHPVAMANAWVLQRPFPALSIVGARSIEQLAPAVDAGDLVLSEDVMLALDKVHRDAPMPY